MISIRSVIGALRKNQKCESVLVLVVRGQQFRYDRISRVEPCMADSPGVSAAGVVL